MRFIVLVFIWSAGFICSSLCVNARGDTLPDFTTNNFDSNEPFPVSVKHVVDYISENIIVKYNVVSNIDTTETFTANITFANLGHQDLLYGNWEIYFFSTHLIQPDNFPYAEGYILSDCDLRVFHVAGSLFKLKPERSFQLSKNASVTCTYVAQGYQVARSDSMPNWYVVADGMQAKNINSTSDESLSFVRPFSRPEQFLRYGGDVFYPFTPEERFQINGARHVKDTENKPVIPTPVHIHLNNRSVTIDDTWVMHVSTDFSKESMLIAGDALFDAGNAVDGRRSDLSWDRGQCAVSDYYKQTATWWVNLTKIHSIHHITIYFMMESLFLGSFRDLATALLGFSLYVSNTTNRLQGTLCFKDDIFTKRTLPAIFNISCHIHGQYVVYYNERLPGVVYPDEYLSVVVSDLCEVEVYGCPATGYYGPNCSIPCPVTCRYCHVETGTCLGCKPGYQGHRCESECVDGKYGDGCQSDCGHCDNLTQCHHVNGTCVSGCLPGYKSEQCKEPCDGGWYGADCDEQCGHCREEEQCRHTNGACLLGCTAGYQGEICKLPCPHGYYGDDCSKRCKDTCVGCNNVNGLCESGCIAGWTGDLCQSKCMDGKYGDGCQYDCGHCDNLTQCHHVNGTCVSGCLPGYKLEQCNEQCVDGKYGGGCQNDCGHCDNLTQCHHVNGTCASGCLPGYRLDHCQEPCPKGYYGRDCNEACGHCRDRSQCSHTNGTCLTGCNDGYHGEMCKAPCPHGSFGKECSKKCSETCVGCNNANGMCDSGCVAGWTGIFCLSVDAPDMMVIVNGNGQQHFPDSKWPFRDSNNHKRQRYSMNC